MSNKTQWTPGPWSANEWATGYTVSSDPCHYSVCHLEGCNNDAANARLIAAAPEMAADIAWLVENFDGDTECTEILDHIKNETRALLAKIKGAAHA